MPTDSGPKTASSSPYAARPTSRAPDWHGLIVWDMLFNNLTTGLFLVAALGELLRPSVFGAIAPRAYPIALGLLTVDLLFLVLDLGDPLRFHHMLRVFKPGSPMSLGTWCLTAYSFPLTLIVALDLFGGNSGAFGGIRWLALVAGLIPALGSAVYKGVLLSTSSQPGWSDARWLGGYLANSAVVFGAGLLLVLSVLTGDARVSAILRPAFGVLLALNAVPLSLLFLDVRPVLEATIPREALPRLIALSLGVGLLLPLVLLFVPGRLYPILASFSLVLLGGYGVRSAIVRLPHAIHALGGSDPEHDS